MSYVWHHKGINRLDTEKLLLGSAKDGSFLIRDSESVANAFVLSLIFQGHIHHYRIFREQDGRFYMQAVPGVENQHFELLEHIVTYYSQPERGLPCQLKYPVVSSSYDDDDSDEDEDEEEYPEEEVNDTNDSSSASAQSTIKYQMSQVNSDGLDQDFKDAAAYYLGEPLLMDFKTATSGGTKLEGLQKLIANSSQDLVKELKLLVSRLEYLQNVFSVNDEDHTTKLKFTTSAEESSSDYEYLCRLLGNGVGGISTLHVQALKSLKDIGKMHDETEGKHEQERRTQSTQSTQSRKFEVIDRSSSFKGKTYLLVDYIEGKISFLKNQSELPEPGNTILHSKILQLIKSRTNIKRLGIKIESKPVKEYEFDDGKSREVFCQLVQQVKNQKSKNSTVEQISVFVGTWNLGDANPPENLGTWFKCQGHGNTRDADVAHFAHDIYAIGTQECSLSENNWVTRIKNELRELFQVDFKSVGTCSLWGIRLVVLVKPDHANLISHVQQSSVKTGIANALGNKGAVGISFMFSATSLCFINCHLAARSTRLLRRKQNYHDILKGLNLGQKSGFDLTNQFHHVFWFGDLNYRLDMAIEAALKSINTNNLYKMRQTDQLWSEIKKGNVFCGFKEEAINFLPTYRHKRGGSEYVWEKAKRSGTLINVPSWCDRVLYHSLPETRIFNSSYGCTDNIRTSDHWPVFSTFDVGIISQYAASPKKSGKNVSKEECEIVFDSVSAKIKTNSKPQFIIEFHSSCLESIGKSLANSVVKSGSTDERGKISEARPQWSSHVLPQNLYPIVPDRNYLQDQHLLLAVKSVDSDESYGECCISLKAMIAETYQTFEAKLTHSGEETGEISGEMLVKVPDDTEIVTQGGLIKEGDDDDVSTTSKPVSKPVKNPMKQPRYSTSHSIKGRNPAPLPKPRPVSSQHIKVDSSAPPPLPAKNRPLSVMDLLKRIGFPQFHDILVNNGFDQVEFLKDISESDLKGTAIPEHVRRKLVTSIYGIVKNQ